MRIAEINMMHTGSTGKIMLGIAETARNAGHTVKTFSPCYYIKNGRMNKDLIDQHSYFGYSFENMLHYAFSRVTGLENLGSHIGTLRLVRELEQFDPDIIHLHNLHNYTINIPILMNFLSSTKKPVVWTFHDCWPFTGRCPYFTASKCARWLTGCGSCEHIQEYPRYYLDQTKAMWRIKKHYFEKLQTLHIVCPSDWLACLVKQSFFSNRSVSVINNGIDLSLFSPKVSNFRKKHELEGKYIILGVALDWESRKGLDVFVDLASKLDERYAFVLVGGNANIDKELLHNVVVIQKTNNQLELAEIYSAADVFVNPTREDNFPTVNIEALACGTPVITFATGGSPEIIDKTCGMVVPCNDIDAMERAIYHACDNKPFSQEACVERARCFKKQDKFQEYLDLYEKIMK